MTKRPPGDDGGQQQGGHGEGRAGVVEHLEGRQDHRGQVVDQLFEQHLGVGEVPG